MGIRAHHFTVATPSSAAWTDHPAHAWLSAGTTKRHSWSVVRPRALLVIPSLQLHCLFDVIYCVYKCNKTLTLRLTLLFYNLKLTSYISFHHGRSRIRIHIHWHCHWIRFRAGNALDLDKI